MSSSALLNLAKAICKDTNDEFVIGVDRIWFKESLNKAIVNEVSRTGRNDRNIHPLERGLDISKLADTLGIFAKDINSDSNNGLIVLEGKVFLEPQIRGNIVSCVRTLMNDQGFIDLPHLSSLFGLTYVKGTATATYLDQVFEAEKLRFVSKQDFLIQKDQERLLEKLLSANLDTVPIPDELRTWALGVCKSHPRLIEGQVIKGGKEYEPYELRQLRSKQVEERLSRLQWISDTEAPYLSQSITSLIRLSPTCLCTNGLLETLGTIVESEIAEFGCCAADECIMTFLDNVNSLSRPGETSISLADGQAALQHLLSSNHHLQVLDSSKRGLKFIYSKEQLDFLSRRKTWAETDFEFCKNLSGREALKLAFPETEVTHPSVNARAANSTLTKDDIQSLFSSQTWPLLCMYAAALTKLKRSEVHDILSHLILTHPTGSKQVITDMLTRLLRISLQLSEHEAVPQNDQSELLDPIYSAETVDQLMSRIQQIAPNSFGLSCLSLDKKTEKELMMEWKQKWARLFHQRDASNLEKWISLLGLAYLSVHKVLLFIPLELSKDACSQLWSSSKSVIQFPSAFAEWSESLLSNKEPSDGTSEFGNITSIDDFVNSCKKIKS